MDKVMEIEDWSFLEKDKDDNLDKFARWFKDNPEKILGEELHQISTIRGKENSFPYVTVIGDKEKLYALDIPDYMQVSNDDPLVSSEQEEMTETKSTPDEVAQIGKSAKNYPKESSERKARRKDKWKPSTNIWSYEEVDKTYNGDRYDKDGNLIGKAITLEEKQAYVLYLTRFTGKDIKGGFAKYKIEDTKENRLSLMQKGVLSFDNTEKEEARRYKPTFYYASGNVREKLNALKRDKDFYVSNFGEDVYDNHLAAINKAFDKANENKLTLDAPDKNKRIFIKIDGKFARDFQVSPIIPINEKSFNRGGSWLYKDSEGKITWKVNETLKGWQPMARSGRNTTEGDFKLSLKDAFLFWYEDFSRYIASDYDIIYPVGVNKDLVVDWFVEGKYKNVKSIPDMYKTTEGKETVVKDSWYVKLQEIKNVGNEIFALFLEKGLQEKDKIAIETTWNAKYNGLVNFDVNKVPVLFQFVKEVGVGGFMDIRPEKRRAIGFNMMTGSSCLAYGVGMGKTFASIFTLGQNLDLGLCKRPLIVVPNSVYPQFVQEIRLLLPQYKVNPLYNLRDVYQNFATKIEDNTISIITKSAISELGFKGKEVGMKLFGRYKDIIEQGMKEEDEEYRQKKQSEKKNASILQKTSEFLGVVQSKASVFFDEIGWDYLVVDEAHNYKNLFASVKARTEEETGKKEKSSGYQIKGSVSITAVKLFSIAQYIQMKNKNGNCLLLTATPFTNTPLEVYAMLSLIRYDFLKANGFGQMADFFDFFAEVGTVSALDTLLRPINKQVVLGFKNVVAMQGLIYSLIDKPTKEEEATKVKRPNKIVLPLWDKRVGEENIKVSESNQVTTLLRMTTEQQELWERLSTYGEGKIKYEQLSQEEYWNNTKCGSIEEMLKKAVKDAEEGTRADYNAGGIRSVFALTYGRSIALSPYLYRFAPYSVDPTPAEFVQASPKIEYAIECIKTVKEHHEKTKTPMSGQVIFMTKGTDCFGLITDYCVEYLGFKEHEVGIIASDNYIGKKKQKGKEFVQDAFLGRKLDTTDPQNPKYVDIPDEERVKVLVGSSSIKEGVNLQFYSTCLYVCEVDWNPTDMTQLEGRIWRQKNAFANVRIVIPLLANSHDGFIYNKLREKTGRINQIWERTGKNEFDIDELDPDEMTRQVSRSPLQIATLIKKEKIKKATEKLTEYTIEYNAFRKVREISGNIIDVYNKMYSSYYDYNQQNPMQYVWNFLNTFRPSLIDKPLVRDKELLKNPTATQSARALKINPDALNYSFEELTELMNQFRKDSIIEYPRGYMSGWMELKEKPVPTFEVGEKVSFETRRGNKEGKIIQVFGDKYYPKAMLYDIQIGDDEDNVVEDVKTIDNKIVSIDNPPEEIENVNLGGTKLSLGSEKSINQLKNIWSWSNQKQQNGDYTSIDYYQASYYPFYEVSSYQKESLISSWLSFSKIYNFFNTEYLSYYGYKIDWSRWVVDNAKYWKENLIPLGIRNEDELTMKLKELKGKTEMLSKELAQYENSEYFEELKKEAILEIQKREQEGDKPLNPQECAELFAKPNPDYLGNQYLDFFQADIDAKEKKIEEAKIVEEEPKELSEKGKAYQSKIRLYELLVKTSKGDKKQSYESKIRLYNLLLKKEK